MPTSISRGLFYILFAGLLWSTGGPLIRLLDSASEWQFLFFSEYPTALTLIGGGILLSAIFIQTSAGLKYYRNIQNVPLKNSYK